MIARRDFARTDFCKLRRVETDKKNCLKTGKEKDYAVSEQYEITD